VPALRYSERVHWLPERFGIGTALDSSHFSHERSLAYDGLLTGAGPNLSQFADHVKGTKEFDRSKGARRVYTLLSENGLWVVVVLEMFLTHKEYEKRFGYC